MSEHTPGPWEAEKHPYNGWSVHGKNIGQLQRVANMDQVMFPGANEEANARLIAAAPDMLAALKIAEMILSHSNKLPLEGYDRDMVAIRKAIDKAEGRK